MNTSERQRSSQPNCMSCRNFYITYKPIHPYGCRAMNFKSKEIPSLVVFRNSGMHCQAFWAKK